MLQKRSALTLAEAEVMHARKRYSSITQSIKVPANYQETLAKLKEIEQTHPALQAINSQIERKQAELEALQLVGSGQSSIVMGFNSDRYSAGKGGKEISNNLESLSLGITVPFGGEKHLAPQTAALNVELNKLRAEQTEAGVVDEKIETPLLGHDPGHRRSDALCIGDIQRQAMHAQFAERAQRGGCPGAGIDDVPEPVKFLGHGRTDAARTSGNQNNLLLRHGHAPCRILDNRTLSPQTQLRALA